MVRTSLASVKRIVSVGPELVEGTNSGGTTGVFQKKYITYPARQLLHTNDNSLVTDRLDFTEIFNFY